MACDLVVTDCFGRTVVLDHPNWEKHCSKRPEIVPYHGQVPEVLADPDYVYEVLYGGQAQDHFYHQGVTQGRFAGYYLRVIVRASGQQGRVATLWICETVDTRKGVCKWTRR